MEIASEDRLNAKGGDDHILQGWEFAAFSTFKKKREFALLVCNGFSLETKVMIRVKFQQVKTNKVSGLGHCWSGKLKQNQSESLGDFFDNKYSVLHVGIRFGFFFPFFDRTVYFFYCSHVSV